MNCSACGHEHQGAKLAHICVGCPCPERPEPPETDVDVEAPGFFRGKHGLCPCPECMVDEAVDEELDDVLVFLRRHERDQLLGITPPPIADLIAALKLGEHRR